MPAAGSAATYVAGFMTATALLHLAGIAVGLAVGRLGRGAGGIAFRAAGLLIAVMGVAGLALSA